MSPWKIGSLKESCVTNCPWSSRPSCQAECSAKQQDSTTNICWLALQPGNKLESQRVEPDQWKIIAYSSLNLDMRRPQGASLWKWRNLCNCQQQFCAAVSIHVMICDRFNYCPVYFLLFLDSAFLYWCHRAWLSDWLWKWCVRPWSRVLKEGRCPLGLFSLQWEGQNPDRGCFWILGWREHEKQL